MPYLVTIRFKKSLQDFKYSFYKEMTSFASPVPCCYHKWKFHCSCLSDFRVLRDYWLNKLVLMVYTAKGCSESTIIWDVCFGRCCLLSSNIEETRIHFLHDSNMIQLITKADWSACSEKWSSLCLPHIILPY